MSATDQYDHVDDDDDESKAEILYVHTVDDVFGLTKSHVSPPLYYQKIPWKIIVVPSIDGIGLFVECNGDDNSTDWSCNATIDLRLRSYDTGVPPLSRGKIQNVFRYRDNTEGFMAFASWGDLHDPSRCLTQNGAITVEALINADRPQRIQCDSKALTGYVGLENLGAICYVNSLVQMLFFTNSLRSAVYRSTPQRPCLPAGMKAVTIYLQKVFYDLQFNDKAASAQDLARAFGLDSVDPTVHLDVEEFLRFLLENLQTEWKASDTQDVVGKLFQGEMQSYINCKHVNYKSSNSEIFYDIQLNIKGYKTIYESFQAYITPETLEGDNKYHAGEYGLQDAEKGVKFTNLPPVLYLHLMRFHYDAMVDAVVKNYDYFEFYENINLDAYMASKENAPGDYVLQAVLVHKGDNDSGHYMVYISPKVNGDWVKFDDDIVTNVTKFEAIEGNYGAANCDSSGYDVHFGSAYVLAYIRKSEIDNILQDVPKSAIPAELLQQFDNQKSYGG